MQVLETVPWDKVKVRVMCVEVDSLPGGAPDVIRYMESQDYILLDIKENDVWLAKQQLIEETLNATLTKQTLVYIQD